MGLFRKMTSVLTLGAVDLRSDKERIAMYTRQTRNAVRAQNGQSTTGTVGHDPGSHVHIAELQAKAAVSADRAARMKSSDPVIRAGAHAEWKAEHADQIAAAADQIAAAASLSKDPALPGWYHASQDPGSLVRYWDGRAWTDMTRDPADVGELEL